MKAASINEIKQELKKKAPADVLEICLRLGRYKKENKELLTFLLFESDNPDDYARAVREEMDEEFAGMNKSNLYIVKKSLRKILRTVNRQIKYSASKEIEIDLLLHFCTSYKGLKIPAHKSTALANLYQGQIKKIRAAIATLHEDLQYEYQRQADRLDDKG
jgi:gas vesicle protein